MPFTSANAAAVAVAVGEGDVLVDGLGLGDADGVVDGETVGDGVGGVASSFLVVSHHATAPAAITRTAATIVTIVPVRDVDPRCGWPCVGAVTANPRVLAHSWRRLARC